MKLLPRIKLLAKVLFISVVILTGILFPVTMPKTVMDYFPDQKQLSQDMLDNSLAKVHVRSQNLKISGSGVLISLRNQINLLTNAHVCLGPSYVDIVFKKNQKNKNINLNFEIKSRELYYSQEISLNEITYNLNEDWCLVPLELDSFYTVILTEHFVQDIMPTHAKTMTYNRQETVAKYDVFTACSTDVFFEALGTENGVCDLDPILQNPKKLKITSNKKESKKIQLGPHYIYKFAPIPGDSGSPVYNKQNQLVGLIVGQKANDKNDKVIDWGHVTPLATLKQNIKNKIIYRKKLNTI